LTAEDRNLRDMQQWLEDYGLTSVEALRASFAAAIDMAAGEHAMSMEEKAHAVVAPEKTPEKENVSGKRKWSSTAAIDMAAGEHAVSMEEGAHAYYRRKKRRTTRISSRGQYFARPGVARSTRSFEAALASYDKQ
jgi:hypothetical protein